VPLETSAYQELESFQAMLHHWEGYGVGMKDQVVPVVRENDRLKMKLHSFCPITEKQVLQVLPPRLWRWIVCGGDSMAGAFQRRQNPDCCMLVDHCGMVFRIVDRSITLRQRQAAEFICADWSWRIGDDYPYGCRITDEPWTNYAAILSEVF